MFIMVVGFTLFVQLAWAIFQPSKIKYKCPESGLNRHEPDAIHCKHCGEPLKIETDGSGVIWGDRFGRRHLFFVIYRKEACPAA